ncbi:hypothetical protein AAU61_04195 [Desulfocarbo indianensis]|nr:hypothetical protein AAU61_04195 [Desulfocarbo indianensis]
MRWSIAILAVCLLALASPPGEAGAAGADAAPGQPAGIIKETSPGTFQWSRFSLAGQGRDGFISADDPQRQGDLKWNLGKVTNPYSMRLPFKPPAGSLTARFQSRSGGTATAPMFGGTVDGRNPDKTNGGYLALEWRTGSLALTLGGGYSQASAFTGEDGGGGGRVYASSRGASSAGGSARYDALRRWGAYLAAPYQITDRIGLRPEVSYFYEDALAGSTGPGNEWVMGLQFNFGF